jgi:hypothetical protein
MWRWWPAMLRDERTAFDDVTASEHNGGAAKPIEPGHRFRLVRFRNIKLASTAVYLVKGLIPREGIVVIWGSPKCGKTFWALDVGMHIALG